LLGTLEEAVYIGTDTRYVIRLTEQSSIVVRTQNLHRRNLHRYASGEMVQVLVSPDSIRILDEDMSAYEGYARQIVKEREPKNTTASV
jgi:spermidine/putrescine transport system ATP-binding protein